VTGKTIKIPMNEPFSQDLRFIFPSTAINGGIGLVVFGLVFFAPLKKIPRNAISQRKRGKLKGRVENDGTVKFTGALKVVKVERIRAD
jgi:hypothetical protein